MRARPLYRWRRKFPEAVPEGFVPVVLPVEGADAAPDAVACVLTVEIGEPSRFKRSRTPGAYFGLLPRRQPSGERDWTGRVTKQGDGTVRKLLYANRVESMAHCWRSWMSGRRCLPPHSR